MKYKLTEKINVYTILAQIAIMWRNRKTITNDVWFFHYRTPRWTFVKNGFQNVKLCWKVKKKIKKFPTNSRKDSQRSYSFQKNRFLRILPMPPVWVTLRPGTSPPPGTINRLQRCVSVVITVIGLYRIVRVKSARAWEYVSDFRQPLNWLTSWPRICIRRVWPYDDLRF